jgi:hypothetical protein
LVWKIDVAGRTIPALGRFCSMGIDRPRQIVSPKTREPDLRQGRRTGMLRFVSRVPVNCSWHRRAVFLDDDARVSRTPRRSG